MLVMPVNAWRSQLSMRQLSMPGGASCQCLEEPAVNAPAVNAWRRARCW